MTVIQFDPIVTFVSEAANYTDADHPNLIGTLHDIECPSGRGWVVSLMGPNYFGNPNTQASAHLMVDAADVGQGGTLTKQLWHVGGPGNQLSVGMEQAGYAVFSRAMWLGQEQVGATYQTPSGSTITWDAQANVDMAAQLELVARTMARLKAAHGIELRWISQSDAQQAVNDYVNGLPASISGWLRHRDWTNWQLSQTGHWDTGDNYPQDVVMAKAIAYYNGSTPPAPTPVPVPPKGLFVSLTPEQELEVLAAARLVSGADHAAPGTPLHGIIDINNQVGPFVKGTSTFTESVQAALGGITAAIAKFAAAVAAKK